MSVDWRAGAPHPHGGRAHLAADRTAGWCWSSTPRTSAGRVGDVPGWTRPWTPPCCSPPWPRGPGPGRPGRRRPPGPLPAPGGRGLGRRGQPAGGRWPTSSQSSPRRTSVDPRRRGHRARPAAGAGGAALPSSRRRSRRVASAAVLTRHHRGGARLQCATRRWRTGGHAERSSRGVARRRRRQAGIGRRRYPPTCCCALRGGRRRCRRQATAPALARLLPGHQARGLLPLPGVSAASSWNPHDTPASSQCPLRVSAASNDPDASLGPTSPPGLEQGVVDVAGAAAVVGLTTEDEHGREGRLGEHADPDPDQVGGARASRTPRCSR